MKKHTYKARSFNRVERSTIVQAVEGRRLTVGVDIAKVKVFATLMDEDKRKVTTVTFNQPGDIKSFTRWLLDLPTTQTDIVMEASGTYGDAFQEQAAAAGMQVFRVSPKRVHDAAEVFDGVPSLHDAKAAELIARLHIDGVSHPWAPRTEKERTMVAAVATMEIYDDGYRRNVGRLEARLARHWPELSGLLELNSATILALLKRFSGPAQVVANIDEARALMRSVGGARLSQEKIDAVLASAQTTPGVAMVDEEQRALAVLAEEADHQRRALNEAKKHVREVGEGDDGVKQIAPVVGRVTAVVLVSLAGAPSRYESAGAFIKALGLNLKVHSSGTSKAGQLHITKRGHGTVRKYLFLAVLRQIQRDPVFRAWYARKIARDGGSLKLKAIVALMRKLAAGLWRAAVDDEPFDSTKLFDLQRLDLDVVKEAA